MSTDFSKQDKEISAAFAGALQAVDTALVSQYRLPPDDVAQIEQALWSWFHRFCRRPGSPHSVRTLRPHLISMACKVGHVYWTGKSGSDAPTDRRIDRVLTLGPEIIAIEVEKKIELTERKQEP